MADNLSEQDIFAAAGPGGPQNRENDAPERDDAPEANNTVRTEDERPTPNLGQLPDNEGEAQPQPGQTQEAPRRSMLDDLKEERKRRQDFERQLAERDRERAELYGRMRQMEEMFGRFQNQPRQAEQPKAPEPAPDPFADPEAFARHQAEQLFQQRFTPFQQELAAERQRMQTVMLDMQRSVAATRFGEDVAREAEEAFNTAAARGQIDPNEHRRINSAPNPFAAAVEWHRRNKALETVGHDPEAWFGSEFERRLQQDPAFKQRAFDMLNGQAQGQAAGANSPAAGKPQPVFTGLPSLNGAPGSSGRDPAPMTESDIFNAAPAKIGGGRR